MSTTNEQAPSASPSQSPANVAGDLAREEAELERQLVVFGEDLGNIPCFRNSFLYGLTGGIGTGLTYFALTSRIPGATKFGFYSYVAITSGYWFTCRYNYSATKFRYTQLKYAMQQNSMREGTAQDISKVLKNDSDKV